MADMPRLREEGWCRLEDILSYIFLENSFFQLSEKQHQHRFVLAFLQ